MSEEKEGQDGLRIIKHDIRNQLSNMYLAIDQLRYELEQCNAGSFATYCVDTIANSCQAINQQLEKIN